MKGLKRAFVNKILRHLIPPGLFPGELLLNKLNATIAKFETYEIKIITCGL